MNNLDKKLQGVANSSQGKIFREFLQDIIDKAADVRYDLDIDTQYEAEVRNAVVELLEEQEKRITPKKEHESSKTSFE